MTKLIRKMFFRINYNAYENKKSPIFKILLRKIEIHAFRKVSLSSSKILS